VIKGQVRLFQKSIFQGKKPEYRMKTGKNVSH